MTAPASPHSDNSPNPNTAIQRQVPPEKKAGVLRKYALYFWVGGLVLLLPSGVGAYFMVMRVFVGTPFTGPTYTVKRETLRVTIVERGSLESAENADIVVRVKAGAKGSTNASTIKWVVDDGTQVKAGDPICDLDDSGYQDNLKTLRNNANKALSDWVKAKTDVTYQQIDNLSAIKTAEVKLIQAKIDLNKYAGMVAGDEAEQTGDPGRAARFLANGFRGGRPQGIGHGRGQIHQRLSRGRWRVRGEHRQRPVRQGFVARPVRVVAAHGEERLLQS